ncbi:MAG: hypothetical protein FD155_91 [Bacteroidetes bacterium]|nr:MAG: hypothetical protein FD155_91 [Bacteroidota bacterium]
MQTIYFFLEEYWKTLKVTSQRIVSNLKLMQIIENEMFQNKLLILILPK